MPPSSSAHKTSRSRDVFPPLDVDKPLPSPITPAVTGIVFPSPVDTISERDRNKAGLLYSMANLQLGASEVRHASVPSTSDNHMQPVNSSESQHSLDELWSTLRQKKERKMAKDPLKIESFGEYSPDVPIQRYSDPDPPIPDLPVSTPVPKHTLRKKKSITTFRDSADGRSTIAFFDVPGLTKNDLHVSFQRNCLVISWNIVQVSEKEEDGRIVRERIERSYNRTIPLPDGTRFEDIRAAMNGRYLMLTYPNMHFHHGRSEPRSRSREHHTRSS